MISTAIFLVLLWWVLAALLVANFLERISQSSEERASVAMGTAALALTLIGVVLSTDWSGR